MEFLLARDTDPTTPTANSSSVAIMSNMMVVYAIVMSLGLGTVISGSLYYAYDILSKKVKSKLYCSVKIKDTDHLYHCINVYMKDLGYVARETNLAAHVMPMHRRKDKSKIEMEYFPGYGNHIVTFKNRTLWVVHQVGQTIVSGWSRAPKQQQWIEIYCWGNDSAIIKEFVDAALVHIMKLDG